MEHVNTDVLVYSSTTSGVFRNLDGSFTTGLIYSGELLKLASSPMGIYNRSGDIIHTSAGNTDIAVVEDVTAPGSFHLLVDGTSVQTIASVAPAIATTSATSRVVRGIESQLTLDLNPVAPPIVLKVTPTGSSQSIALDGVVTQLNAAIAANPSYRNRVRITRVGTTQLRLESVERAGSQSIGLSEQVLTDPLGLNRVGFGIDAVIGTHPVMPVGDGGVDVNFSIAIDDTNGNGGNLPTVEFNIHVGSDILDTVCCDTNGFDLGRRLLIDIKKRIDGDSLAVPPILPAPVEFRDSRFSYGLDGSNVLIFSHSRDWVVGNNNGIVGKLLVGNGGSNVSANVSSSTTGSSFLVRQPRPANGSVVFRVANSTVGTTPEPNEVIPLGDISLNGLSDIAVVNELGQLDVFYGSPTLTSAFPSVADLTVTSPGTVISAAAGDFNGDYKRDLAVVYQLSDPATNRVAVFSAIAEHVATRGASLDVIGADYFITPTTLGNKFATQISSQDLTNDGIDDLIIGTLPDFNTLENDVVPDGGRIYVAYGSEPREILTIPSDLTKVKVLENFSVAGSGSFVADRGTGRPELFDNGGQSFEVVAGSDKWFKFTTLGDGKAGDTIRLLGNVTADLVDENGLVLDSSQRIFDLRLRESGTYFLRVTGDAAPQAFSIEFDAPIRGQTHKTSAHPDRDLIHGGDGDDVIVGNSGLDRLFGDSGNDQFTAEPVESRDQQSFEASNLPPVTELSFESLEPVLDPVVDFANASLQAAVADPSGVPVTYSGDQPVVHGRITESQLTPVTSLDVSDGIVTNSVLPTEDTFVSLTNTTTVFGNEDNLWAIGTTGFTRIPLVKFDLSSFAGDTVVEDVVLNFIVRNTTNNASTSTAVDLYEFGKSWNESSTWNSIGGIAAVDYVGAALDRQTVAFVPSNPTTHTISYRVPSRVIQGWIDQPEQQSRFCAR